MNSCQLMKHQESNKSSFSSSLPPDTGRARFKGKVSKSRTVFLLPLFLKSLEKLYVVA